jgi:hypothetical protein
MKRSPTKQRAFLKRFGFVLCGKGRVEENLGVRFSWIEHEIPEGPCAYVALLSNGKVLKTGVTSKQLKQRWKGSTDVIDYHARLEGKKRQLREHEKRHGLKMLTLWAEHELELWAKPALMTVIPYAPDKAKFPAHYAEEVFLDDFFDPLFGTPLAARKSRLKGKMV